MVLIPVTGSIGEPRVACEGIENMTFTVEGKPSGSKVLNAIMYELGIDSSHNIEVYPMTDFMDAFNDEVIKDSNYFISYVHAK